MRFLGKTKVFITSILMSGVFLTHSHSIESNSKKWSIRGALSIDQNNKSTTNNGQLSPLIGINLASSVNKNDDKAQLLSSAIIQPNRIKPSKTEQAQISEKTGKAILLPLQPRQESRPKNALSLKAAINLALARHPSIVTAKSIEGREQANVKIARSSLYPQVSFGGGVGNSFNNDQSSTSSLGLNVEQLVYDFNRSNNVINAAMSNEAQARANTDATLEQVSSEVAMAFIAAQRAQALHNSAKDSLASLERMRDIIELRADSGVSDQADLVLANVRVDGAQSELIGTESAELAARSSLRSLIGRDYSGLQSVDKLLSQIDKSLNRSLINNNPNIIAARQEVQSTKFQANAERASVYPSVNVSGSYQYNPLKGNTDSRVMLSVKGNIYQGGATRARIAAANDNERAALYRVDSIMLTNGTQFDVASEEASGSSSQKRVVEQQINRAIASRDLFFEQYQLGKRSLTDLLNSDAAIYSAINAKIEVEYRYRSAIIRKAQASGLIRSKLAL